MLNTLAKSWLELQCRMIPSVQRGLVAVGSAGTAIANPTASWPGEAPVSRELTATARLALEKSSPVVQGHDAAPEAGAGSGAGETYRIACPVLVDGHLFGVVAVEAQGSAQQRRAVMQLLQWGASWLEFLVLRETSAVTGRLVGLVEVIAAGLEHRRFVAGATSAATELSRVLAASRVSIGFVQGGRSRLRALSHSARFAGNASLVRAVEAAMDEAIDQHATITYPGGTDGRPRVVRAHASLASAPGSGSVCTVPFGDERGPYGAVVAEREGESGFDRPSVELCEAVAALVGPILQIKRLEDRWVGAKLLDSAGGVLRRMLGPGHLALKLAAAATVAVAAFLATATGTHRVTAPAAVQSTVQRVVAAPRDGYLAAATVRAGDVVTTGQIMAALETEQLELERLKLASEREQLGEEHREAFAKHDRVKSRILEARRRQVAARLDLVDAELARSSMHAPFDGVVVEGDLSQSIGAAVARGDTLFTVAPLEARRVVVEVHERDVARLREGQPGTLALTSLAEERLPIVVERVTPVSTAAEGRNFFRVEARLEQPDESLRPGMQGVAKIDIGQRRLAWIWTHGLVDRIRLGAWRWQ